MKLIIMMKNVRTTGPIWLLVFVLFFSPPEIVMCQKFQTRTMKDRNGYIYETVSNDPAGVRIYTLKNGMKVYLSQNFDEPRIRTVIALRAGSSYDPPANTGLAHYLEHLMFNGTNKIGALNWTKESYYLEQIAELFENHRYESGKPIKKAIYKQIDSLSYEASKYSIAGEYRNLTTSIGSVIVNGITFPDFTAYLSLIPATSLEKFLYLETERFNNIALRNFHTELEVVYEEFNTEQDRVFKQKYYAISEALFEKHPYGQQHVIGTAEHLKNPSIKAIRTYFEKYYVPNNMAVILIGDLQFDKTIQVIDKTLGGLKARAFNRPSLPKEPPILENKKIEISGPDPASVYIGFRFAGVRSEDEKFITLVDMMLGNGVAGLFDINLKASHQMLDAQSSLIVSNDYIVHFLDGYPNEGQSLDEVKELMLGELEKIKSGNFPDWLMQAAINDLKKRKQETMGSIRGLDGELMNSFIQSRPWKDNLDFLDELQSITKKQLTEFAQKHYQHFVVLFKMKGPPTNITKVENPGLTPIRLNADSSSLFAKKFISIPSGKTNFQAVDFSEKIQTSTLENGIKLSYITNSKNNLFQLDMLYDIGRNQNKKLGLAIDYLSNIGTEKYTAEQLKQQFYKYGLTFLVTINEQQTNIHLEGLQENMEYGISLINDIMDHPVADQASYTKFIDEIINARRATASNKRQILFKGLANFALYGEDAPLRNIYSESELRSMNFSEMPFEINNLKKYKQRVFYFGNNLQKTSVLLTKYYKRSLRPQTPAKGRRYDIIKTIPSVYLVNFNQVQADVLIVSRGEKFSPALTILSNMFNRFMEKLVNQEIREKRSLAYSTWGTNSTSPDTAGYNYFQMFAGTQANKLNELLKVMTDLMKALPESEALFQLAKEDQLKRYEAERIISTDIFWTRENQRKQGFDHDFRKNMYEAIQKMTFNDIKKFFSENIAGRDYAILVVANKKDIDIQELSKYGEIKELTADYLFNYY
jgi:zinc protease